MGFIGIYFEWGLFVLMLASGIIYLVDQCFFYKKRKAIAEAAPDFERLSKKQKHERLKGPIVTDYARSLFWVFVIVLGLRSFLFEPYVVPSGSMLPTIQLGDFILVNKFDYGLRLPLIGTKIMSVGEPKQGDVVVFKNPVNPQVDFIKTVIGLPGDKISYINKKLFVNGQPVPQAFVSDTIEPNNANLGSMAVKEFKNDIGGHTHTIYNSPNVAPLNFQNLVVPQGEYFVMGDNRDNSDDSRDWGFVPEHDVVGKAWMIFFSFDSRTHHVRWNRIGKKMP